MHSLKAKTTKGLFWSFSDSFGVYLIKLVFSILIARALSPEDYGLMGMIVIFISLGQMIMQGGFSMALIQKKDCTDEDLSTGFWFNVLIGLVVYSILFLSASGIASFYSEPILIAVIRVSALNIIINAFSSVHVTILSRNMDFKRQTYLNLTGALVSGIVGLWLAANEFKVWALVFQTLAGSLISMTGLWIVSRWRPEFIFSFSSFKSLYSFGYKIFLQGFSDVIFSKVYFPIIGKLFTVSQLGFFTNANRFYDLFVRQTSSSFGRVIFPAFASINDQKEKFTDNYIKTFQILFLMMSLMSILLIITAKPFVGLLLTEKWLPAVPLMTIFFIEGFFFPLYLHNQNILCSMGLSGLSLKLDILKKILTLASIIITFRLGISALIYGQVISTFIAFAASLVIVVGKLKIRISEPGIQFMMVVIISLLCFGFDRLLINPLPFSDSTQLLIKIAVIGGLYMLLAWRLKVDSLRTIVFTLKSYYQF